LNDGVGPVSGHMLHFRLDPGEPGVLRSSPAGTSTLRVFAQETRNLTRLKGEAAREGREVIYSDVRLGLRRVGNRVVAASGHTRVVTRPREEKGPVAMESGPIGVTGADTLERERPAAGWDAGVGQAEDAEGSPPSDSAEAQREKLQLKLEAAKLDERIEEIRSEDQKEDEEVSEIGPNQSEAYIDQRLDLINAEIRKVEFRLQARKLLGEEPESLRLFPEARRITYLMWGMPLTGVLLEEPA